MKTCNLCKRELEDTEFSKNKGGLKGLMPNCKKCRAISEGARRFGSMGNYYNFLVNKMEVLNAKDKKGKDEVKELMDRLVHARRIMRTEE